MKAPGRTPIVNESAFSDAHASGPPAMPIIGSPSATFNPANASAYGPEPNGPPRTPAGIKGKRPVAKGLTNKRFQSTL